MYIRALKEHAAEAIIWRIIEFIAISQLNFCKITEVLLLGIADGIVLGVKGLDDNFALAFGASAASGNLRDELKTTFSRAEVGDIQRDIGVDYAHQGDEWKVQSFGDHLGAEENVYIPVLHPFIHAFQVGGRAVTIQPQNPGGGEEQLEGLLHFLGSR